jgi:hypothetical protein
MQALFISKFLKGGFETPKVHNADQMVLDYKIPFFSKIYSVGEDA